VTILAVPVIAVVAITVFDLLFRPGLRRLALRNVTRRKGEALLVVAGSMLATAIITSSFVVGDTLGASIRDTARTQYGPVDETVRVTDLGQLPAAVDALTPPPAGTDGVLQMVWAPATVATPESGSRRAEPRAGIAEVDFDAARAFGGDAGDTGFADAGVTPGAGEAVLGADLAAILEVGEGDAVEVFAYGQRVELTVSTLVPRLGVAGYDPLPGSEARTLFVAPGTVAALAASRPAGASPPDGLVFVSNEGGVFDGANGTAAVLPEIERRVAAVPGVEVTDSKRQVLEDAEVAGRSLTQLFATIGGFSVIAGILLLVNIFVMLSEERKTELGVMRAVGLKRNHLVRAFGMEGAVYAMFAAVAGAVAGIGVGRVIVWVTSGIMNDGDDFRTEVVFAVAPASVVTGLMIGLSISLLTVWGTSLRIGRLNVIRAIRDVAEPEQVAGGVGRLVLATVGVLLGGLLFAGGRSSSSEVLLLLGPALALFSSVPLLARVAPGRVATTVPAALALAWGTTAFVFFPDVFESAEIAAFVVQGVVLVMAGVTLVAANADQLNRLTDRLSGSARGLAARLGLAYPLAKRFRTALLLGMYAIVVFTLTVLATFSQMFAQQAPRLTEEARAGYDVLVQSNPANPATVELLEQQPEVTSAAPLQWGFPKIDAAKVDEPIHWSVTGFDERFLAHGGPTLGTRDRAYASDLEAWQAVLADPSLAVVPGFFLQEENGPPSDRLHVGDTFTVINPVIGAERTFRVAATVDGDWTFSGAMMSSTATEQLLAGVVTPSRHFVALAPGVDAERAAAELTGRLVQHGVDADSFASLVDAGLSRQAGFFRLMQGFLSLGLVIGIAGLGVVMIRAVRERRRQIGMLRAMGFTSSVVRRAFLVEASFVAILGIAMGVSLGLVTSWSLLTQSAAFGDQPLPFSVPWGALAVLGIVPLGASLLAAFAPAAQASRIMPAAALRIAE
jgi:putative ABC transport system permease protein